MLTEAVRLLSDPRLEKGDTERLQRAGWNLLPLLVVTSTQPESAELSFTFCVARSRVIAKHPLTLNWAKGNTKKEKTAVSCLCFKIKACCWDWEEGNKKILLINQSSVVADFFIFYFMVLK